MKKLMIMLAIVGAAVMAQAGAVRWSAVMVQSSGAAYVGGTTQYSAYLYVVSDSVTLDKVTGYLDGGKVADAVAASAAKGVATATSATTPLMNFTSNPAYGSYVSQSVSAFMVIFDAADAADASNYLVAKANGTGDAVLTKTFGTTGDQTFGWNSQAANTAWKTTAVPEPTSGLLLLLGMAGLALKRKRA